VHVQLPVRLDRRLVAEAGRHAVEGVALEGGDHRAEELAQRLLRLACEAHEDEARPQLAVHGNQSELALVQVEELAFLLDEAELALEVVAPTVVLAGEL